jgi:hypothetical protein
MGRSGDMLKVDSREWGELEIGREWRREEGSLTNLRGCGVGTGGMTGAEATVEEDKGGWNDVTVEGAGVVTGAGAKESIWMMGWAGWECPRMALISSKYWGVDIGAVPVVPGSLPAK